MLVLFSRLILLTYQVLLLWIENASLLLGCFSFSYACINNSVDIHFIYPFMYMYTVQCTQIAIALNALTEHITDYTNLNENIHSIQILRIFFVRALVKIMWRSIKLIMESSSSESLHSTLSICLGVLLAHNVHINTASYAFVKYESLAVLPENLFDVCALYI